MDYNYEIMFLSLFILIYIYSIFRSTKHLYLLFPFFFLVPPYLYFIYLYHSPISEQIIGIVSETNFQEACDFLGGSIWLYSLFFIIWIVLILWICCRNYKRPIIWSHRSRYWILFIGTIYIISSFLISNKFNRIGYGLSNVNKELLADNHDFFYENLKKTYPLGLVFLIYNVVKEQNKLNSAFNKNDKFEFKASQYLINNNREIYILVIGETSRRENWQLNGYERQTNPKLMVKANLVNFSDMLSLSSATRSSIPMILTRKPSEQVYTYDFPEKSIISAFKEVGFNTYWISTQQKFGKFDTTTSVYAKEANQMKFLNKTDYTNAGNFDDILIPELRKIIKEPGEKKFIILHTLGSHYNYLHRYPESFNYFKPSLSDLKNYSLQDENYRVNLINSYDNSILFTDYFLGEVINILDSQVNTSSFLLYTSDHGEDLFDEGCSQSGHGLTTKRNFEIASFAWYSDDFNTQYADKIKQLEQNKDRKINHQSVFPTLLDAANIQLPQDNLKKSLFKKFNDYPRVVMATHNYDKAEFVGVCKEIK